MASATFIPKDREGWWGGPDLRVRCTRDFNVVLTPEAGERHKARGGNVYVGKRCGHLHVSYPLKRPRAAWAELKIEFEDAQLETSHAHH